MSCELPSFVIGAGELLQHVSRTAYRGMPLYYGRNATNRYDDPARHYGVLYMGFDLATALMESVFHKHRWLSDTKRVISLKEARNRMIRLIEDIDLVDHVDWPLFISHYRVAIGPDPE
ncbi:MAG: RES domain-containing protein [Lautropia sp.]|nr:RES domain-containing protein [Lautropia sp.]